MVANWTIHQLIMIWIWGVTTGAPCFCCSWAIYQIRYYFILCSGLASSMFHTVFQFLGIIVFQLFILGTIVTSSWWLCTLPVVSLGSVNTLPNTIHGALVRPKLATSSQSTGAESSKCLLGCIARSESRDSLQRNTGGMYSILFSDYARFFWLCYEYARILTE